jgi:hypothetical protein
MACSIHLLRTQPEALDLAGLGLGQGVDELHRSGVLIGRDRRFDMVLQALDGRGIRCHPLHQHDIGFDDLSALAVFGADDRAFGDFRMREQGGFDLGPGDVVAGD